MRIQWRPLLVAIPLQIILALAFAALAYPAMILGEFTVGDQAWHRQMAAHGNNPFSDPMVMSLWLASFVSFLPTYGFGLALVTGLCALYAISEFRAVSARRSSASGARRAWRRCACSSRRTRCSICCTPSAATSNGTRKGRKPWCVQLADLLRRLLNAGERDFSRLADELQFVRLYLELQQKRFADRLTRDPAARPRTSSMRGCRA